MLSGGCACGAVRYTCAAAPVSMVNCHCRDCQRAGGAGFSPTLIVAAAELHVTHGTPAQYRREADSGNTALRSFCAACGSPLFAQSSARADFVGIRAGSLDDPSAFVPTADVWVSSAQPWDVMDTKLPKHERNRGR